MAWWCFVSFFVACAAGIAYLKTRRSAWDLLCAAAVETGMVCATLALLTGSIWARHSWGVWWTWDPRLTTTLILWFIYAGYMALRGMDLPPDRRAALGSVVAVIGWLYRRAPGLHVRPVVAPVHSRLRPFSPRKAAAWNPKWPWPSWPRCCASA